ncbi:MAG: TonB-dependent receptor [Bacteroidales bacterium]|nr:TonB-dependent receptor [Bacteroidales bacterium]
MSKKFKSFVCLLLLMFGAFHLNAQQSKRLTVQIQNGTILDCIKSIEGQTDYSFLFSNSIGVEKKVSVNCVDQTLDQVLSTVFTQNGIAYDIDDRQITLRVARQADGRRTISGTVTDKSGEPLAGVGVLVDGTSNGTVSDLDGTYSIVAPAGNVTLNVASLGYVSKSVQVRPGQGVVNVVLEEESMSLDETVIVGYATQKKANLTGAVATVNVEKDINQRTTNTISNLLAGAAPGLVSMANSSSGSRPGANSATLRIRGTGTTNDASPLVIVDGVVASMDNVNPADVENISILKDAASSAIYGSRAANGVILITTKKGSRTGKPKVTFNGLYSLESVYKGADYFNIESNYADYMEWMNLANTNAKGVNAKAIFSADKIAEWRAHENDTDPRSKLFWPNTDWTKEFFRLAKVHNHTVAVQGGSDNVRYYVSGNFYLNPGVIQWTDYKKFSVTANIDIDVTKFLTLGLNLRGYRSEMDPCSDVASSDGDAITYGAAAGSPGVVLKSPDGRYGEFNNGQDNMSIVNANAFRRLNFFAHDRPDITHSIIPRLSAKLTPFKGMEIEGSYTYNYRNLMIDHLLQDMDLWRWVYNENGTTEAEKYQEIRDLKTVNVYDLKRTYYYYHQTADLVARYNTEIGDLKLGAVLGTSGEYYKSDIWGSVKFNNENLAPGEHNDYRLSEWSSMVTATASTATVANNTIGTVSEWAMRSYFGRVNLNWKDKYLLEANLRVDGSSRFAPENRWGWFPSVSAGWVVSEEGFFPKSDFLNFLKIRGSWGSLGNNAIGNYDWQSLYSASNYVLNNGSTMAGLALNSISNRAITWEKTTVTNIGLDFNLLRNRLTGTAELYDKITDGILLSVPASLTNGTVTIPKQNAAVVQNRGVELQLGWRDRAGQFGYNITGNVSYNRNKVVDYATPSVSTYTIEEGQPLNYLNVFVVDRMIRTDEDVEYVNNLVDEYPDMFKSWAKPEKGDLLYKDVNGDGTLNTDDRFKQSNGNMPVWSFGLSLGADWKGFDFSLILNGIADWKDLLMDNLVWNPSPRYGYSLNKTIKDGAFQDGVNNLTAKFPRPLLYGSDQTRNRRLSSFWVYDRAYIRLKNVQLGYTVPARLTNKFHVDRLRVFTSVDNAFTLTEWPGFDPEIARSRAKMNHPTTRVVTFGANITL